jgi:hypothetical protein
VAGCTADQIEAGAGSEQCDEACCSASNGACSADGICRCDADHHGVQCELDGSGPGDPDDCPGLDLARATSPYEGSTASASNAFSTCWYGWYGGRDQVFFIDLLPGQTLDIGQTRNGFKSVHSTRWGGSCPGDHVNVAQCTDDSNLLRHQWTNDQGRTERAYFVIDGYRSGSSDYYFSGSFTLTWTVTE